MATFFKSSTTWVIDFRYDGRARRWFKAYPANEDAAADAAARLAALYDDRAMLVAVRPATEEEERAYLRGEQPVNVYCSTGR